MHSPEFTQRMKDRLLEEKDRLQDELDSFSAHTEMGSEEDENASEVALDEVNQDIIATLKSDMVKVQAALAKIEQGGYGTTAEGQEIPESRLEVIPWADTLV